jgi:hypothetical protein
MKKAIETAIIDAAKDSAVNRNKLKNFSSSKSCEDLEEFVYLSVCRFVIKVAGKLCRKCCRC